MRKILESDEENVKEIVQRQWFLTSKDRLWAVDVHRWRELCVAPFHLRHFPLRQSRNNRRHRRPDSQRFHRFGLVLIDWIWFCSLWKSLPKKSVGTPESCSGDRCHSMKLSSYVLLIIGILDGDLLRESVSRSSRWTVRWTSFNRDRSDRWLRVRS